MDGVQLTSDLQELVNQGVISREDARGSIYVHKAPSCYIGELAEVLSEMHGKKSEIKLVGTRHGEKIYETLVSEEEMAFANDHGLYYSIPLDERDLNYDNFVEKGSRKNTNEIFQSFNSHNTEILSGDKLRQFLNKQEFILEGISV